MNKENEELRDGEWVLAWDEEAGKNHEPIIRQFLKYVDGKPHVYGWNGIQSFSNAGESAIPVDRVKKIGQDVLRPMLRQQSDRDLLVARDLIEDFKCSLESMKANAILAEGHLEALFRCEAK